MGRRDEDDLPRVEILGAEREISSVTEVSTGRSTRRRRWRGLGLTAAVVALVVAGLALGGEGDPSDDSGPGTTEEEESTEEESTTTHRRSTTTRPPTTTTTTIPAGPLFAGQDVHGWLLSGNPNGWTLVDIETGARLDQHLPFDDPYGTRTVTGGIVVLRSGEAEFHDLRIPEDVRQPVVLGRATQVFTTVDDHVWLIEGADLGAPTTGRARLVDLEGRVLRDLEIPSGAYSIGITDGLLFGRAGRVYLVTEAGVQAVAVGDLIGASGSSILVFSCNDDASSCGVDLRTTGGRLVRRLDMGGAAPEFGWPISTAPDGRFTILSSEGPTSRITIVEPDGRVVAEVTAPSYLSGPVSWVPGGDGLISALDGRIVWIHQQGDKWLFDPMPGLELVQSDGVLAISPG